MHKARAFFFVCAGIFLLALSYHLGARSAGAQAAGSMEAASFSHGSSNTLSFVVNRVLYTSYQLWGSIQWKTPATSAGTVPGTAPVAATSSPDGVGGRVLLTDGDLWMSDGQGWIFIGNQLGANPTPAQSISIGQLKAKYAK